MSSSPSFFLKKWALTFVFSLFIPVSAWGNEFHLQLSSVPHDGYCFYHAVAKALNVQGEGHNLYRALSRFLNSVNAEEMPWLESLLASELIGSSISELSQQLQATPPTQRDWDSWAGFPEVVAMAQMLDQPNTCAACRA